MFQWTIQSKPLMDIQSEPYEKLKTKIQEYRGKTTPSSLDDVKKLFATAVDCVRQTMRLEDAEIVEIHNIARDVYMRNDSSIQSAVFRGVRELIKIFESKRPTEDFGRILKGLLTIYPDVILRYSSRSKLFTEAAKHARNLCRNEKPYRLHAMETFKMSDFGEFPAERFEVKAKKKLLKIVLHKIACNTNCDRLMPGAMLFLSKLYKERDFGTIIKTINQVLCELLEECTNRHHGESFSTSEAKQLYSKILDYFPSTLCFPDHGFLSIAKLMKYVFKYGDTPTKSSFVELNVFKRMHELFHLCAFWDKAICELLEAVNAASSGDRENYIDALIRYNLISVVMSHVEAAHHGIRSEARDAVDAFLKHASFDQVRRAAERGFVAELIKLLRSSNESTLTDALRWLKHLHEKISDGDNVELLPRLERFVRQHRGDSLLGRLRHHKEDSIAEASRALYTHFATNGRIPPESQCGLNPCASS